MLEKAIQTGIELTKQRQAAPGHLSNLSKQLSSEARTVSVNDWVGENQGLQKSDHRFAVADRLLSQIYALDALFPGQQFESRLQEVADQNQVRTKIFCLMRFALN